MPPLVTVAADVPAAARVLLRHSPDPLAAGRLLDLFAAGEADPAGLLSATDNGTLVGAAFGYLLGGRQAAIWPPTAADPEVEDALVGRLLDWFRAERVVVAQAVVREHDRPRAAALERAGFRHLTQLVYQVRDLPAEVRPPNVTGLGFRPVSEPADGFAELLDRTYDGTLDCPELNGTRTPAEVLDGYRTSAGGSPLWWEAVQHGRPVGVVVLSAKGGPVELSYLGLVPDARRRGLGRHLLRFALHQAARRAGAVTLSADERNEPALRLYRAAGFREFDRRHVFLAFLDNSSGNSLK